MQLEYIPWQSLSKHQISVWIPIPSREVAPKVVTGAMVSPVPHRTVFAAVSAPVPRSTDSHLLWVRDVALLRGIVRRFP